jgi:hypothetical protein
MLGVPLVASPGRAGYWLELLVALVVVAVAQRRLGPSSSATTSTVDRALPSSAVQARCCRRPTTTTRLPFASDWAGMLGLGLQAIPAATVVELPAAPARPLAAPARPTADQATKKARRSTGPGLG